MDYRLILASQSPRRKEILEKLNIPFEIIVSNASEESSEKDPGLLVRELAGLKAEQVLNEIKEDPRFTSKGLVIIGADTVVEYEGRILGKPHSRGEAVNMLRLICGGTNYVHTGVCILIRKPDGEFKRIFSVTDTAVDISFMDLSEIERYVDTGEPMDKAGAYAIQGLFAPYISAIRGDYYNVVGLPINNIYQTLKQEGVINEESGREC